MEDKILVNLSTDHTFESDTDIIGREGEGNTSRFEITIPEKLIGCSVYLDFEKPNGEKLRTPKLEIENSVAVYDVVPYLLTDDGEIKVQAVLKTENGQTWKSSIKICINQNSINALDDIPEKEDFMSEAQKVLDELSQEIAEIAEMLAENEGFVSDVTDKVVAALDKDDLAERVVTELDKDDLAVRVAAIMKDDLVVGIVDENNTITLGGNLADGTYAVKYAMDNGNELEIGDFEIDTKVYHRLDKYLENCALYYDNDATRLVDGESYYAQIDPNYGYVLTEVIVNMADENGIGHDITASAVSIDGNRRSINIERVTGHVIISAKAEKEVKNYYNISMYLENCKDENGSTGAWLETRKANTSFAKTITANDGYTLSSVVVSMGGEDISATAVSGNLISIESVTGDVDITAKAE